MRLFLKYILRYSFSRASIARTLFILLSLIAGAALICGSFMTTEAMRENYETYLVRGYGAYNVQVRGSQPIEEIQDERIKKQFLFTSSTLRADEAGSAVTVAGISEADFQKLDFCTFFPAKPVLDGTEGTCVVSETAAKAHGWKVGTVIEAGGVQLEIKALANKSFLFAADGEKNYTILVSPETQKLLKGTKDQAYIRYMEAAGTPEELDDWLIEKNQDSGGREFSRTYERTDVDLQIQTISIPLFFMMAVVLLCTVFLILSSYRIILFDRLRILGIFLSQGMSKAKIVLVLAVECGILGAAGGIAGGVFGNLLCWQLLERAQPLAAYGVKTDFSFSAFWWAATTVFMIVLSMGSACLALSVLRKFPITEILTDKIKGQDGQGVVKGIIGAAALAGAVLLYFIYFEASGVSLFLLLAGTALVIPLFIRILLNLKKKFWKNEGSCSVLTNGSVFRSGTSVRSVSLIAVVFVLTGMLGSISYEMSNLISSGYKEIYFDAYVNTADPRAEEVETILEESGYDLDKTGEIKGYIDGKSSQMLNIMYVDPADYLDFEEYIFFEDKRSQLEELAETEDGIILSEQYAKTYDLQEGEQINIRSGQGKTVSLKVVSLCNPRMWSGGNYNLITRETAQRSFGYSYPQSYYVSGEGEGQKAIAANLEKQLSDYDTIVYTKSQLVAHEESNLKQIAAMLNGLISMIVLFSAMTICANLILEEYTGKRERCVLQVLGASSRRLQLQKAAESLTRVVLGAAAGIPLGILSNRFTEGFMKSIGFEMEMVFQWQLQLAAFVALAAAAVLMAFFMKTGREGSIQELFES